MDATQLRSLVNSLYIATIPLMDEFRNWEYHILCFYDNYCKQQFANFPHLICSNRQILNNELISLFKNYYDLIAEVVQKRYNELVQLDFNHIVIEKLRHNEIKFINTDPIMSQGLFEALYQEAKEDYAKRNQRWPANSRFDQILKEQYRLFIVELNYDLTMAMSYQEMDFMMAIQQQLNKEMSTMTEIIYLTTMTHNICQTLKQNIINAFKGVSEQNLSLIMPNTTAEPPGRIHDVVGRD